MNPNSQFKKCVFVSTIVASIFFGGCASQPREPSAANLAQAEFQDAITTWQYLHDYHHAVAGLEKALNTYSGQSFRQSTLTALAMVHLDYGNRLAFLETVDRLEVMIGNHEYIESQTQHVLTVAFAMNQRPPTDLPGRGYDHTHIRSVYALLGAES